MMQPTWDAAVTVDWGGERRLCRLRIGELRALQDATGRGPEEIFNRLRARIYFVDEVRKIMQLGLEGGGLAPQSAMIAVERHVDGRPLTESVTAAMLILAGALWLPEALNDAGKPEGDGETTAN